MKLKPPGEVRQPQQVSLKKGVASLPIWQYLLKLFESGVKESSAYLFFYLTLKVIIEGSAFFQCQTNYKHWLVKTALV